MSQQDNYKGDRKPNPVDVHVGKRIRMKRSLLGMSQEKLAEQVGLTFQQIQKYERGTNRVSASRLYQFGQILSVPVSYFYAELAGNESETNPYAALAEDDQDDIISEEQLHRKESFQLLKIYYSVDDNKKRKELLKIMKSIVENL